MNNLEIKEALLYNIPTLFFGEKGWGKTQTINSVAKEHGYDCYTLLLADVLPEDLSGIPSVDKDNKLAERFLLKTLKDVENNLISNKKTLLFLDEITQCSPQVMNCLYYLVENRRIGGIDYPELRIIGATNYDEESDYLTDIPEPLKDRFYITNWINEVNSSNEFLKEKHNIDIDFTKFFESSTKEKINFKKTCNPRNLDKVLNYFSQGLLREQKLINLCGSIAFVKELLSKQKRKQTSKLSENLKKIKDIFNDGGLRVNNTTIRTTDVNYICDKLNIELSSEELELLNI